jgi:hypothetical protein
MNKEYKTSESQRKAVRKWTEEHKERKKELDRLHNIRRRERIKKEHQELMKLQNNWNKLKEHIGAEWYCFDNESVEFEVAKDILNKMIELEGSDNK